MGLGAAMAVAPCALDANQLTLVRNVDFDDGVAIESPIDVLQSSTSATRLYSGISPGFVSRHYTFGGASTADCTGLVGGFVTFGRIALVAVGTSQSNASGCASLLSVGGVATDRVVVQPPSPSLVGHAGTLNGNVVVKFVPSLQATGANGNAAIEATATMIASVFEGGYGELQYDRTDQAGPSSLFATDAGTGSPAPATFVVPVSYPFVFGTPFDLSVDLGISGSLLGTTTSGSLVSASGSSLFTTLTWQGITSVHDDTAGTNVVGSTITADSGTNYTTALPAPPTGALVASGVAGIVGLVRRRAAERRTALSAAPRAARSA